jgi:lipopolysaccharide/colanic/teichoic acid biosynthesis glycosyltransferase
MDRGALSRPYLILGTEREIAAFRATYAQTGLTNPLQEHTLHALGDRLIVGPGFPRDGIDNRYAGVIVTDQSERLEPSLLEHLVRIHFDELRVTTMTTFYGSMWRQVPTLQLSLAWALDQDFHLSQWSPYTPVKRSVDLAGALIGLVVSLPLLVGIAAAVGLTSRGGVIYSQSRTGRNGRPFTLYKFRTMFVDQAQGSPYTLDHDTRITPVGAWLRRARLDELPQLVNVVLGDMSIIGPRAEWTKLVEEYEKKIPGYHLRHLVRPGITGWAQLNFRYGNSLEDAVEKLKFDLYYIKYYSLILDLEILLKTVVAILGGRGK